MKSWNELSDFERRAQIALRLGWHKSKNGECWGKPHWNCKINTLRKLPGWPTDDGLAFSELWPKLLHTIDSLSLRLSPILRIPAVWNVDEEIASGDTWADAISHAFYNLVPLPKKTIAEEIKGEPI